MQLSPDFFSYFEAAAPILDADDSLMCVSSWNDHGQASWDLALAAAHPIMAGFYLIPAVFCVLLGVLDADLTQPRTESVQPFAKSASVQCHAAQRMHPAPLTARRIDSPRRQRHAALPPAHHVQSSLPCMCPQDRFVKNATQLYRSDFFPGLGWMLNKRVWHSVRDAWCVPGALGQRQGGVDLLAVVGVAHTLRVAFDALTPRRHAGAGVLGGMFLKATTFQI